MSTRQKTILILSTCIASISWGLVGTSSNVLANEFKYDGRTGMCLNAQGVKGMNPVNAEHLFVRSENSQRVEFLPTNAECVDFSNFDFEGSAGLSASLVNWNMRGANLDHARLGLITMENPDLSGAKFSTADFAYTMFIDGRVDQYTQLHSRCSRVGSHFNVWCIQ